MHKQLKLKDLGSYGYSEEGIKIIEKEYNAKHVGFWCLKTKGGGFSDYPVDVFYVENPDKEKGHTHYFGFFSKDGTNYICRGDSAFEEQIIGVIDDNDEVLVSRYRHHFLTGAGGVFIDGGRDYTRTNSKRTCSVIMDAGEFVITEIEHGEEDER